MASKGKTPSLTADGNKFTASWSPAKNYTDQKIEFQFKINSAWNTKTSGVGHKLVYDLKKGTSSKAINVDPADYYPKVRSRVLYAVRARLQYKTSSGWSGWGSWKTIDIKRPKALSSDAKVHYSISSGDTVWTYSWDAKNSTKSGQDYYWRTYYVWQTILMDAGKTPTSSDWTTQLGIQKIHRLKNADDGSGYQQNASPEGVCRSAIKIEIVERQEDITANKVRWFRVVTSGPQGHSQVTDKKTKKTVTGWRKVSHPLGELKNNIGTDSADIDYKGSDEHGTSVTVNIPKMTIYSGDKIRVNYAITAPAVYQDIDPTTGWVSSTIRLPNGFTGWTQKEEYTPTGAADVYTFETDDYVGEDCLLFLRFDRVHDGRVTEGTVIMCDTLDGQYIGRLSAPTLVNFQPSENPEIQELTITVRNNAALADGSNRSFIAVYLQTSSETEKDDMHPTFIIPYSEGDVTRTFQASYTPGSQVSVNITAYVADFNQNTYEIRNIKMRSFTDWDTSTTAELPKAPENVIVTPFVTEEDELTALVTWDWSWEEANVAEVTWSTSRYAWESTSDPSSYSIVDTKVGKRYVSDLQAGNYYFRVRLIRNDTTTAVYGPWCDVIGPIKMTTAPSKPTITLSVDEPAVVALDDEVTVYWGYENADGTPQIDGRFATAVRNQEDTEWIYTEIEGLMTGTATKKTFTPAQLGWVNGETYNLVLRLISSSGEKSESWSNPVQITVAPKPVITVTGIGGENDSLKPATIVNEDDTDPLQLALTKMPIEFSVSGCGKGGHVEVLINRADDFERESPDDYNEPAYAGETIVFVTAAPGTDSLDDTVDISIDYNQLNEGARFDNLQTYTLNISIVDQYGQTDHYYKPSEGDGTVPSEPYTFTTYWEDSALIPEADVQLDSDEGVVYITPTVILPQGETLPEGDYCQIWRLSADSPQLIVPHGSFNTMYVDTYPTFGKFGGYRVVYVTRYGDYKTDENISAWTDYPINYNKFLVSIDFDDYTFEFQGNVSLSHSWKKDFQLTKYLGGSVEGDWTPGIERSGSINGVIPVQQESEALYLLRLLADYSGVCHVRTPDGSNFYADIEVKDDREEKWINKLSKINLTYTRVDANDYEAVSYDDWTEE